MGTAYTDEVEPEGADIDATVRRMAGTVVNLRDPPVLGWQAVAHDDAAAARLLLEAPPDLGERASVFVCALCGDLDYGAVSVIIERDGDEIVWRDPADTSRDYEPQPGFSLSYRPSPPPPEKITMRVFPKAMTDGERATFAAHECVRAITDCPLRPLRGTARICMAATLLTEPATARGLGVDQRANTQSGAALMSRTAVSVRLIAGAPVALVDHP